MTIIAAFDLSPIALNAARTAARLARKLGDSLLLVRVLEPHALLYPELATVGTAALEGPLRAANEEALQRAREALADERVEIRTRLVHGAPAQGLASCAQDEGARLIVMGTHGRGAGARLMLGSVAQRTVLAAPCPVLVVREGKAPFDEWVAGERPLRVVAGIDRSAATEAALAWIGELRQAGPCDVTLVHEYLPVAEYARLGLRWPREPAETEADIVGVLERELRDTVRAVTGDGEVQLRIRASWGRIGDTLAIEAEAERADLLVVGTEQPRGWQRLRRGSDAIGSLHATRVPTVCVPARARPAAARPAQAPIPVIRSVLVATDFSELGDAAVAHACSLVRGAGGAVELCHVHERGLGSPPYAYAVGEALSPSLRRELERRLEALVPDEAAGLGIQAHATVIDGGSAAEQILQAARRLGADVIAIGSHGRSGVARALFGSVAEAVVRGSERPVHVVRTG